MASMDCVVEPAGGGLCCAQDGDAAMPKASPNRLIRNLLRKYIDLSPIFCPVALNEVRTTRERDSQCDLRVFIGANDNAVSTCLYLATGALTDVDLSGPDIAVMVDEALVLWQLADELVGCLIDAGQEMLELLVAHHVDDRVILLRQESLPDHDLDPRILAKQFTRHLEHSACLLE